MFIDESHQSIEQKSFIFNKFKVKLAHFKYFLSTLIAAKFSINNSYAQTHF